MTEAHTEHHQTIVIGGGQAGLSVGYHLQRRGLSFTILNAHDRVGDSWRERWDSLRLFTPAPFNGLDGMPFPANGYTFPSKDEMAVYLEQYAERFALPVRSGVRVDRLSRNGAGYLIEGGGRRYRAENVIVAMSNYQRPAVPDFADQLRPDIMQLHSARYRNPAQVAPGGVLIVGAANSGAEIARELALHGDDVWMSGRDPGHLPFRIEGLAGRVLLVRAVLRGLFHRVLTVRTPIGRRARPKVMSRGTPLIRLKPRELDRLGIRRAARTVGVRDGRPLLEDGHVLEVANVIWCTGYRPGFAWIDLPVHGERGHPRHDAGVVPDHPGLYFVGLNFLYAMSSGMIHGVGRDADRIAGHLARRAG